MGKVFDKVRVFAPKRNKFDLSHQRKFSMNEGVLVPILCQEILPGDSWRTDTEVMARFAPMVAPIMQNIQGTVHNFFVPYRLIWDEFEPWITGGETGTEAPVMPYIRVNQTLNANGFLRPSELADYLGFPAIDPDTTNVDAPINISALPFRAYQLIYSEYYRDQNLQSPIEFSKASGMMSDAEAQVIMARRFRCWEKDYFTSALPNAQRGAAVNIPISDAEAEVEYYGQSFLYTQDGNAATASPPDLGSSVTGRLTVPFGGVSTSGRIENIAGINISGIAATINDLRTAIRTQTWLEKMMLGGSRYIEQTLVMFGVKSSDARLQRPEFLGGGTQPVVISEVLSTAEVETAGLPQGNMAGHGISIGNRNGFSRNFEEHGFVISILSFKPKTSYQQGIPKMFLRQDKFDLYWPDFAHLGEQAVQNQEIYWDPEDTTPNINTETFGYQSRYAEYKYIPDYVAGQFRTTLSHWHQGRIFENRPQLNSEFVTVDASPRIWAVPGGTYDDHLFVMVHHRISAIRPIPYFSTPQI